MKGMKALSLVLAVALLGSLIPLGLAANMNTNTTTTTTSLGMAPTVNQTANLTREKAVATELMRILNRTSVFAEKKIGPLKDKLPANSSVLGNYSLAEEYKVRAFSEYGSGDYCDAIIDSLTTLHHYRLALEGIHAGKNHNVKGKIRAEIERTNRYLKFVGRTIEFAKEKGIDVSNVSMTYNATLQAYRTVLDDLKEKNFTKAKEDFQVFRERKAELDKEMKGLRAQLVRKDADKIVKGFLVKGEMGIKIAEKAIQLGNEKGYNTTRLQESLKAFIPVYQQVKTLANESKWDEALTVIQKNRRTIMEFHRTVAAVLERTHGNGRVAKERAFLHGMRKRIQKDEKALHGLKMKGVSTKRAELQLRVAVQEIKIGEALLRQGKPVEAKAHFEIALGLLSHVEEFIVAHS
ncbi:hypothetical protein [Thermococcus sp.]|uniref:hypothetical protein n=1 Tax=Thermococcus sp. TaxID=35749 RepID=UPI0026148E19|nr:hypothetical protein [Thermococcus sp.]